MNFTGMLMAPFSVTTKAPAKRKALAGPAIKAKSRGRYRLYMEGRELTTSEIASRMGITNAGCLNTLKDMEKEGLVERAGLGTKTGPGKAPIIWRWKNEH